MQPPSSSPLHHVVLNSNNNTTAHHHQHLNNSNMLLNFAYQSSSSLTQQQSSSTPDHGLSSSNYHQVQQFSSEPSSSQISHYSNNHNYQPNNNNHHTYISMSHDQNFQNINTNHIQPHAQPSPSVMSMIENVPSSTTHNLIKNEPFSTSSSTENFYYNNHSSTMSNPMVDKNEQHAGLFDSLFHNSHQQNTHHYQGNSDPNTNLGLHNFNIHQTNVDVNSGMNNTIVGTSSYATANNTASLATILMNQTSQQQGFTNHSLGYSQISSQNNLSNMNNNTCGMVDLLNSEGTTVTPNISNSTLYTNHNMIGVTNNSQPGTMDQTFMNQQTGCYQQNQPFHFHNNVQNNSSTTDSYSQQGLTSQYQALQTPQPPQMPSSSFTRPSTTHDAALLDDEDLQEKPKKKNSKKKASKSANSPRSSTSSSPSASPTMVRKHRKNIAFEDIAACFEMPIRDASQMLGVSLTQLKRLCREFKIPRWPYRRLNSIQRRIEVLQIMQQRSETKNDEKSVQQTQMEIDKLQQEIIELKTNPSPNLISTLLNDGTLMTSGSVPSSSTEDSGTPSSLNDQFSFPTQDITRSPYNSQLQ
ncbi:hypothetical protein C9374_004196 [Naegleria lovaniensis]|uniref:RWP-RK domain-containing protein n=1 Tax=Naegleria lovaniensis TaxID=51637 RepID=A0AA88KLC8_NAELO|nr:uncharacterized protein C9374_004196 [Naegleria lovaniensis]KAG2383525.1 hypothetical protein C9374_004196 [Naegleria lovaniensis]